MKAYNKQAKCIKCGSYKHKIEYIKSSYKHEDELCFGFMEKTCLICGYSWYERPLDWEEK